MAHLGSFQRDFNEAFIFSVCRAGVKDGLSAVPLVQSRLRKYLLQLSRWTDPFLVSAVACATQTGKKKKKCFCGRTRPAVTDGTSRVFIARLVSGVCARPVSRLLSD